MVDNEEDADLRNNRSSKFQVVPGTTLETGQKIFVPGQEGIFEYGLGYVKSLVGKKPDLRERHQKTKKQSGKGGTGPGPWIVTDPGDADSISSSGSIKLDSDCDE